MQRSKSAEAFGGPAKRAVVLLFLAALTIGFEVEGASHAPTQERTFLMEEKISLKTLPRDGGGLCVWIPYPVSDDWQAIDDFKLVSPFNATIVRDREYGNRVIFLESTQKRLPGASEVILSFRVHRKEFSPSSDSFADSGYPLRFLKPDRLVPVNGRLKSLAMKITKDKRQEIEKVRAIYDYVINELTYSKDDPKVCGIGDSLLTLQYKKGICTDYHSLFISLVRSLGIPAKFEIGFRIPADISEGRLNGYHCWAKFYIKGKGWIPVDISEADKHPERRDYFFGNIDANRVHFTTGRDINLEHAKSRQPLNFFIYPYTELDGVQFTDMDIELTFKDYKGGG